MLSRAFLCIAHPRVQRGNVFCGMLIAEVYFFMPKRRTYVWSLVALSLVGLFFALYQPLQEVFLRITNVLGAFADAQPVLGPLIFIGLAALSVLLGPASSGPLVPSAVSIWGAGTTAVYLITGWLAGALVTYGIGYTVGFSLVERIVGPAKLRSWMEVVEEEGTLFRLFLFRLLTPAETGYLFGMMRYPFVRYVLLSAVVEGAGAFAAVYAGQSFFKMDRARFFILFLVYLAVAGSVVFTIKFKRKRRLQRVATK